MIKKFTFFFAAAVLSVASFGQGTPLYMGANYESNISVIDTSDYSVDMTIPMTSDAGDVNGCYGLSLHPFTGDMYILYQLDAGGEDNRRLGIIDLTTGAISDIGVLGNMNDIGFVNDQLYATTGSSGGGGQDFYSVDITDASSTLLLSPSTDNEACGLIHNYFNGNVYYADEDHFSLIDLETNTETLTPAFPSFPEEVNSLAMLTETTALVGNYNDLFLFDIEALTFTSITSMPDNIHGMAFAEYPLIVRVAGPTEFCSTDPSILSTNEEGDTYQWYLDGEAIDGATDAEYVPTESGMYSCEVDGEFTNNALNLTVIPAPEASFTATPNPVFLGDDPTGSVAFENTTTGDADVFHWDFDNGFTSSTENPTFPFVDAGEYDVIFVVTDSETGCIDTAEATIVVTDNVGILADEYNFSVYPTITRDFVVIDYTGTQTDLTATLIDLNGKVVESKIITPETKTGFDLSNAENGMYIIKITSQSEEKATYRVVKQ